MAVYKRGESINKFLLAFSTISILSYVNARIDIVEDKDLTGCSVELNSYIFNLNGLKRSTPK